ncbi:MAG: hypothetical protein Q9226_005351 [Calogaya cf. arnoldii]
MLTPSLIWLVAAAGLCSVVSTAPTGFVKRSISLQPKSEILDSRPESQHSKRQINLGVVGAIPSCAEDPSYAPTKSKWQAQDGIGILQDQGCYNQYRDNGECWTDTFAVTWQIENEAWEHTGQTIHCETTADCSLENIVTNQTCTANKVTQEDHIQAVIEYQLPKWFGEDFSSPKLSTKWETTKDKVMLATTCKGNTAAGNCKWDDQGCHAIWTAQRNRRVRGYRRRSCKTPRDGPGINIPNSAQRMDGFYTVGMLDFEVLVPESTIVGCAADCGAESYRGLPQLPAVPGGPIDEPAGGYPAPEEPAG